MEKMLTERYVYAATNEPIDGRWKVWAEWKEDGVPKISTEEVYNSRKQAIRMMGSYAKHQMGWKRGSYWKSIDE